MRVVCKLPVLCHHSSVTVAENRHGSSITVAQNRHAGSAPLAQKRHASSITVWLAVFCERRHALRSLAEHPAAAPTVRQLGLLLPRRRLRGIAVTLHWWRRSGMGVLSQFGSQSSASVVTPRDRSQKIRPTVRQLGLLLPRRRLRGIAVTLHWWRRTGMEFYHSLARSLLRASSRLAIARRSDRASPCLSVSLR